MNASVRSDALNHLHLPEADPAGHGKRSNDFVRPRYVSLRPGVVYEFAGGAGEKHAYLASAPSNELFAIL